ncbi:MAG: MFS transporter, partial [Pseudomonadota bacterium]
ITFIVEHAPSDQRGLIGSSTMFSLGAGVLLGIVVSLGFSTYLSEDDFMSWGWRLPFIISLVIGTVAFYIKNYVSESPVYLEAKKHGNISKAPVSEVFKFHLKDLLIAIAVYMTVTLPFYTFIAFFSTYLQSHADMRMHDTLVINGIAIAFFMATMPISGFLSDKYGRKPVLMSMAILIAIVAYPVFSMLLDGGENMALYGQIIFGMVLGAYMGPVAATLVELFPTNIRFTGLSLSYNISAAVFGGTAPIVYLKLIAITGSVMSPVIYLVTVVFITILALLFYRDSYKDVLAEK